jgi:hypothetical protein
MQLAEIVHEMSLLIQNAILLEDEYPQLGKFVTSGCPPREFDRWHH